MVDTNVKAELLPISAVVPTRDRSRVFLRMLQSLASQTAQPAQMIVVDGSRGNDTESICSRSIEGLTTEVVYIRAESVGAATQRNQALKLVDKPLVLFMDDDIVFQPDCLSRMWRAINSDNKIGGVSAMITNQRYSNPGIISRTLFYLLHGRSEVSYAGLCIGPALNLLPEDSENLPEVVPVEWLNTTCTVYRREALPHPLFDQHFTGYSLMEDLALSLRVAEKWKLANSRTARIFHDSQPADYKSNASALARMELINRHYVMTKVLGRNNVSHYLKLALLEAFGVISPLVSLRSWIVLPSVLLGKTKGLSTILFDRYGL